MGKSGSKQFTNKVLKAHNENRAQHSVPPLKLCKTFNQETDRTLHSQGMKEYKKDRCGEVVRK
ncbi:Golgi-associated plant pathogenesis-related protein 1-like [Chionomys nivalis]|uniref:Golgi-associated plant pathogenesis-related protein 1-like n=1 Tax=Chionomys nivalis TaxID=269649 RepID=UPI002596D85C|nr:Golgi-associated plant pathogenesis-related protein 1-like [Chionomys nivalis]